jgi:hypothetical protein
MATLTMDMSSYEIERSDKSAYGDEILNTGWNPDLELQQYAKSRKIMPPDTLAMDAGDFIKKMHAIEANAEVFLKNMYTHQR